MRERDKELAAKKKALTDADKRIAELDVIIKRLYEDNITGKLTDERFIKLSRDYELEQGNLKANAEITRQDVKQQEQKKGDIRNFIATTKKYTDLKVLDATVLREFIDRIEVSATNGRKGRTKAEKDAGRKIHIVYNFIGAFDFEVAAQAKTTQEQRKTA